MDPAPSTSSPPAAHSGDTPRKSRKKKQQKQKKKQHLQVPSATPKPVQRSKKRKSSEIKKESSSGASSPAASASASASTAAAHTSAPTDANQQDAPHDHALSRESLDAVREHTVRAGARKSKVRRQVPSGMKREIDALAEPTEALPVPHLAPGMLGDMPRLEGQYALDDWMQRYRKSETQTSSIESQRRSVAEAIRATLTPQDALAPSTPPPEPIEEITVEQFFAGDLDGPLVGSAIDMHEMLTQLRQDIEKREALKPQNVPATVADTEVPDSKKKKKKAHSKKNKKKKKKRRRVGDKEEAESRDATEAAVVWDTLVLQHLEPCSRAYCADFLREPRGVEFGERPCKRDKYCIFVLLAARYPNTADEATSEEGFVCREFLRPSELDTWKNAGELPEHRRMCLGCDRLLTTFYYYMYQARGETPVELIQTHYNLIDEPGEYDAARCLFPNPDPGKWTGIARPFVEFASNTFVYVQFELVANETGRKWKLLGAQETMTDFRLSPSSYDAVEAAEVARLEWMRHADDDDETADAADQTGPREAMAAARNPRDPRAAWVAGAPGAMMTGVPPCRPLRTPEWIAAEDAACPGTPGMRPHTPLVPRLLLGQAYPDFSTYVFCPFSDTVDAVREAPARFAMAMRSLLMVASELHSFDSDILRAVYRYATGDAATPAGTPTYAVLLAVLYRIDYASKHIGTGNDRRYDYWLQLFIDTHIDLCIAMHTSGLFDDAALISADMNPYSLAESLLDQNAPHDTRCAHAGGLPDLSACMQFASVWFQMRAKSHADNVAEALVHLVARKTQTHKCQVRNFASIAFTYAQQFPQILTLFRALATVSLLGNYPHALVRPDFSARVHIVYGLRRTVSSDREFSLWIADNEQLMYAIVKEYYRYLVAQRPAFEAVLEETTHWGTVRGYITDAMDRARTVAAMAPSTDVSLNGLPYGPSVRGSGYAGHGPLRDATDTGGGRATKPDPRATARHAEAMQTIANDMKTLHEFSELPLITKLRTKGVFTAMALPEMGRYFNRTVLDPKIVRPQTSLTALAELDGTDTAADIVRAMRYIAEKRIPQHVSSEPIELGWLGYLGVTRTGLARLRALCFDYETKDIADNSIQGRLAAIFKHNARDFFVMHTFFEVVADWRAAVGYKLPACFATTQEAALRAKTFTPPWTPLPEHADVFAFCSNCSRWLSDTVDVSDESTRGNMYSMNFKRALYSHDTGSIYCDQQKINVNTRKRVESGAYADVDVPVEDAKDAKCIRRYLSTTVCSTLPAVPVHMIGRCQRIGKKLWALCEACGTLTQWDGAKFGPNGFTCGFHSEDAPRALTAHQAEAERLRESRRRMPPVEKCSFCKKTLRPGEDYAQTTVLDDYGNYLGDDDMGKEIRDEPTWAYMSFVLCRVDGAAVRITQNPVVRRSQLERSIRRIRKAHMKSSMQRYGHAGL